jgi:hypothetical protein
MKSELRRAWAVASFFVGTFSAVAPVAARGSGLARFAGLPACLAGAFLAVALVGGFAAFFTLFVVVLRAGAVLRPVLVFLVAIWSSLRAGARNSKERGSRACRAMTTLNGVTDAVKPA